MLQSIIAAGADQYSRDGHIFGVGKTPRQIPLRGSFSRDEMMKDTPQADFALGIEAGGRLSRGGHQPGARSPGV